MQAASDLAQKRKAFTAAANALGYLVFWRRTDGRPVLIPVGPRERFEHAHAP